MNLKNALIAVGFALLTVIAAAGWSRKPVSATTSSYAQPTYYDANGQAVYGSTASRSPVVSESSPVPCIGNAGVAYQSAVYEPEGRYLSDRYGSGHPVRVTRRQEAGEREYVEREGGSADREVVYRHGRSTKKSVAIVAGSAAGGALIGGLAGGGKGAGIGAASGGAAGFLYDRLTHNHR